MGRFQQLVRKPPTPARGGKPAARWQTDAVDIEAVIAALGDQFTPDEAALVEEMLRRLAGTIPDRQMVEEIGLALAIHRQQQRRDYSPG